MKRALILSAFALALAAPAKAQPLDPSLDPATYTVGAVSSSDGARTLAIARRYTGGNPTRRRFLWCQDFVNFVERRAGRRGTGSRHSHSSLSYGSRVARVHARPGDIVVLRRGRTGGHSGFFSRWADGGRRVVLVSGNSGGRRGARVVTERAYEAGRILGIRRPQ